MHDHPTVQQRTAPWAGRRPGRRARASRRSCRGGAPAGRRPGRPTRRSSGTCGCTSRRRRDRLVPGRRPDGDLVAVDDPDVRQLRDRADVDEHGRRGQPQLHHRQQRVAAGEQLGVVAVLGAAGRPPPPPNRPATYSNGEGIIALTRRGQHRPDDVVVAGAAAEVALQALPDLLLGRVRVLRAAARPSPSPCPACRSRTAARAPAGTPACTGCSSPSATGQSLGRGHRATVRPARPAPCTTSPTSPSSSTVQAPHEVVSQPTLAARSPHTSRR